MILVPVIHIVMLSNDYYDISKPLQGGEEEEASQGALITSRCLLAHEYSSLEQHHAAEDTVARDTTIWGA